MIRAGRGRHVQRGRISVSKLDILEDFAGNRPETFGHPAAETAAVTTFKATTRRSNHGRSPPAYSRKPRWPPEAGASRNRQRFCSASGNGKHSGARKGSSRALRSSVGTVKSFRRGVKSVPTNTPRAFKMESRVHFSCCAANHAQRRADRAGPGPLV